MPLLARIPIESIVAILRGPDSASSQRRKARFVLAAMGFSVEGAANRAPIRPDQPVIRSTDSVHSRGYHSPNEALGSQERCFTLIHSETGIDSSVNAHRISDSASGRYAPMGGSLFGGQGADTSPIREANSSWVDVRDAKEFAMRRNSHMAYIPDGHQLPDRSKTTIWENTDSPDPPAVDGHPHAPLKPMR